MNYRHSFHAGNHADVLKHVVLLAMVEAFKRKSTPFFALDTHAGRGRYLLQGEHSDKTGEARAGIFRLMVLGKLPPPVQRYLKAVQADNPVGALVAYPGSPMLLAQAMRADDRLAACELQHEEAKALELLFRHDARVQVQERDGYGAVKALLPPKLKRGLVLIDPPYEAQEEEYPRILAALADGLQRWPTGSYAVWYPIKQRRTLAAFMRKLAALPCKSILRAELLVRPDDSPLRLNGSGMVVLNPPYKLDQELAAALPVLAKLLADGESESRLDWLKREGE
jgi:23S rRNA (adenine2030-N6)-methyltransferase